MARPPLRYATDWLATAALWTWLALIRVVVFVAALTFPGYFVMDSIWHHFPATLGDEYSTLTGLICGGVSLTFWAGVRSTKGGRRFVDRVLDCAFPPY